MRSLRRGGWASLWVVAFLAAPAGAFAAAPPTVVAAPLPPPPATRPADAPAVTADGPSASDIFLLADWEVTNPRVSWRLDQKVVDGLKLQREAVAAEESRLKALVSKSVDAEASAKVSFAVTESAGASLSANPLQWGHVGVEQTASFEAFGRIGAVASSKTSAENERSAVTRQEVTSASEFVRAVSDPRLQVTVTFRNRSDKDMVCRGLELPILMKDGDQLGAAVPVDGAGRPGS